MPTESILPKKIIRAKLVKGYYLLAYVIKSIKTINGIHLIRTFVLPGGNRNNISLQGLSSGLYFLQLQHQGATQVFEIRKE